MNLNKYWPGIQDGDEKSLEGLFREIHGSLFYYSYYYTEDQFIAEEIVQDVFIKIWQDRNKINLKGSLSAYLYKAVRNHAINFLIHKKTKKYAVHQLTAEENWTSMQEVLDIDDFIIEHIEAKETEARLRAIIDDLPEQCKKIFLLSRFEGKSNNEIAALLKISVNTVKAQIYRALEIIRKIFNTGR